MNKSYPRAHRSKLEADSKGVFCPAYADNTSDRLLNAAIDVFAERGFGAATTRAICQKARSNIAAVNYHFGGKLPLYREVLRKCVDERKSRPSKTSKELSKANPLAETIKTIGLEWLDRSKTDSSSRILLQEFWDPTPGVHVDTESFRLPWLDVLTVEVANFIGSTTSSQDTKLATQSIAGQLRHFSRSQAVIKELWPEGKSAAVYWSLVVDHVLGFSLGGLQGMRRKTQSVRVVRSRGSAADDSPVESLR